MAFTKLEQFGSHGDNRFHTTGNYGSMIMPFLTNTVLQYSFLFKIDNLTPSKKKLKNVFDFSPTLS